MLKDLTRFALVAVLGTTAVFAQSYKIDPSHSSVDFGIRHMGVSTVRGSFHITEGTVTFDAANPAKDSVEALIDVASVDTGMTQRDAHLKSPDFFDTAKFPTATFKSTSVTKSGAGYDVTGDLMLHGVTKAVTLHMDAPTKEIIGMDKKPHRGFSASTTINRKDFGLNWSGTLSSGDAVLGDDVKLTFDIDGGR
jgi:polyisoprenoid-binding protein YceI